MNPVRPLLVVNDFSGPLWRRRERAEVITSFRRRFFHGLVREVPRILPGEGTPEPLLPGGTDLLIIYGGDGTVNRAIQDPIPPDLPILVLPGGTGNVLARFLETWPGRSPLESLWTRIALGKILTVRPGLLGTRPFLLMAGIGWDGLAARMVKGKASLGSLSYYLAGIAALLSPSLSSFRVHVGRREGEEEVYENVRWCLISRLPPYLGPFSVPVMENAESDLLTVTLVTGSRVKIPEAFLSFLPPFNHEGDSFLRLPTVRSSRIEIFPTSGAIPEDLPGFPDIQVDGETLLSTPLLNITVGVSERSLSFLSFRGEG